MPARPNDRKSADPRRGRTPDPTAATPAVADVPAPGNPDPAVSASPVAPDPARRSLLKAGALVGGAVLTGAVGSLAARASAPGSDAKTPPRKSEYNRAGGDRKPDDAKPAAPEGEEAPTEADIEGPYYRDGAPETADLTPKGAKGKTLVLTGTVVARNGRPIPGALLDVWQADSEGHYDNEDDARPPKAGEFTFRGKLKADKEGRYKLTTIKPGHYPIGGGNFRPAHLHVKVSAEGYKTLTTQIYFKGDPHNKRDRFHSVKRELDPAEKDGKLEASFKFVLAKA